MRTLSKIYKALGYLVSIAHIVCISLLFTNIFGYTNVSYWFVAIPLYITLGLPMLWWAMWFLLLLYKNLSNNYWHNKALRIERKIKRELDEIEAGINKLQHD